MFLVTVMLFRNPLADSVTRSAAPSWSRLAVWLDQVAQDCSSFATESATRLKAIRVLSLVFELGALATVVAPETASP
jgi:hypothetical protein